MKSSTQHPDREPGLALVLGAGGTKGWAHAGVLKVLHEAGVPVDLIVGASAGALIGPLYAAGRDAGQAHRIAMSFTPGDFLEWFLRDLRLSPRAGRMGRTLWQAYGRLDFDDLDVPFAAVALDLTDARTVVLSSGNVARAVEASIRPLVISRPVLHEGRFLVDGGLRNAVPVKVARDLGARAVVSVSVGEFVRLPSSLRPLAIRVSAAIGARSGRAASVGRQVGILAGALGREGAAGARADIEIRPDMRGISPIWPWHIEKAARRGEAAARGALPAIHRLLAARGD